MMIWFWVRAFCGLAEHKFSPLAFINQRHSFEHSFRRRFVLALTQTVVLSGAFYVSSPETWGDSSLRLSSCLKPASQFRGQWGEEERVFPIQTSPSPSHFCCLSCPRPIVTMLRALQASVTVFAGSVTLSLWPAWACDCPVFLDRWNGSFLLKAILILHLS